MFALAPGVDRDKDVMFKGSHPSSREDFVPE